MTRKNLRTNVLFSVQLLIFLSLSAAFASALTPQRPKLRVGVVLGLTGIAATHADAIRKGIDLAAEELLAEGWDVQLLYQDDQGNPAKTVSSIQYLQSLGVKLFIGPTWSFQVSAAQKVLAEPGMVAVVPGGSSEINGGPGPGIFNLCPPRTDELPIVADWLKKGGYKKGFVLTPLGDWGEVHRSVFTQALRDAGAEIVADEKYDYGADLATFVSIISRVKEKGADVILTTGAASDDANILKARKQVHYKVAVLMSDTLRDIMHLNLIPAADPMLDDAFAIELPISKEFEAKYRARYGEAPLGFYSDRGYDALKLLLQGISETDGSGEAIRQYFAKKVDMKGVSGRIRFSQRGDVQDSTYVITTAKQGS